MKFDPNRDLCCLEIRNMRLHSEVDSLRTQYYKLKRVDDKARFEIVSYKRYLHPEKYGVYIQ